MIVVIIRDLIGVAGAASVSYGAWSIYHPLGFIVGGALAIAGAWLHGRAEIAAQDEGRAE
jgi:hypothetical protein